MKRTLLALAVLLGLHAAAWAQFAGGNVYGTTNDESGAALPGATATLTSTQMGTRTTTSGSQGDFRFLNVDPGKYQLVVALTGFATVKREVVINTGVNVNVAIPLKVATVEETVTVTAETPIVDTKKSGTGTNLSRDELSRIPNGRDPWVLLQTVPGVVVDRLNIAGNESGQQSSFQGKGSERTDATWSLDGVTVTDTGALGSSPNYFDFNSFDEVNFSTGGNDLKQQTGGIGLSFVTRRGTNSFHGAVNGVLANHELESSNLPDSLVGDPASGRERQGRPHRPGGRVRGGARRADREGQALVLALLRQAGHPDPAPQPDPRPHGARQLERKGELAARVQGHALGLLVSRARSSSTDARARPRAWASAPWSTSRRPSGARAASSRTAGRTASSRSRRTTPSARTSSPA